MMKSKRGNEDIVHGLIFYLITGVMFLIIIAAAITTFLKILPSKSTGIDCDNSKWWDGSNNLMAILKQIDSGELTGEFLFYNKNCNLVSFSITQPGISDIQYYGIQPREPMLCLCNLDDDVCKPYDCYHFKNFDQINTKQFSTEDLKPYVFLKIIKDGRTLRIESVGDEKLPEPITYTKSENQNLLDKTGFLDKLSVIFMTREIKKYNPIVNIKEQGILTFVGIPNIEGFTTYFDLDLALPPKSGQTEEDYYNNHDNIDPSIVKAALIEFSIPKSKSDSLTQTQRDNLVLYYRNGASWSFSPLTCNINNEKLTCGTVLHSFSKNFAISTISARDAYTSDSEKEIMLSSYILEKSIENGIDPLFIKSIIKVESDWNTKSVSSCGAAGLVQLMPPTAAELGLKVLNPLNNIVYDQEIGCLKNKPYGDELKKYIQPKDETFLATEDERFDDKKAIVSAIYYFLKIKDNLRKRGIPTTNENMAAAYNIGPNGVTADGKYNREEAYRYVTKVKEVYTQLQDKKNTVATIGPAEGTGNIATLNDLSPEKLNYLLDDPTISQKIKIVKSDLPSLISKGLGIGQVRSLQEVNTIVLHHTGGRGAANTIQTLETRGLSSHYVLDKDGTLYYLVPENVAAWHAGCCLFKEYDETTGKYPNTGCCTPTEASTLSSGLTCKKTGCITPGVNSKSIGIEIVNMGDINDPYTNEQYVTLNHLLPYLTNKLGIPYDDEHIIGHYEVTRIKNDPKYIDWARINLPSHQTYDQFSRVFV